MKNVLYVTSFLRTVALIFLTGCFVVGANAQSVRKEKMANLSFMVGNWVGTSKSFKEGATTEIPAFEQISYKVDAHLITIDLFSESLSLHTVIYYDEKEQTYYYCPFYQKGAGKYKGEFKDGKFLVWFNEQKRLTFHRTPEGHFQEYGENLQDGKWVKYFEDTFKEMP